MTTATQASMGAVPTEKAGIGSAINDTPREVGGTLGVGVIGSVFAFLYAVRLAVPSGVRLQAVVAARESVGDAFIAAHASPRPDSLPSPRSSRKWHRGRSSPGSRSAALSPPPSPSWARSPPPFSCPPGPSKPKRTTTSQGVAAPGVDAPDDPRVIVGAC
jgi:hypothetical protein